MTRKTTTVAFLGVLAVGLAAGWTLHALWRSKPQDPEAAKEVQPAEMDVVVVTGSVSRGRLPMVEPAVGVVHADMSGSITLSSRAGGRVVEVLVNPGAIVRKGDTLLRFDPVPLKAAVTQATAQSVAANNALLELDRTGRAARELELRTAAAKAEAALTQGKLAHVKNSHAEGLVSDQALAEARQAADQAQAEANVADQALQAFEKLGGNLQRSALEAAAQAAQAALHEAELALEQATVAAPVDGQIGALTVRMGDHVQPGASLGAIVVPKGRIISFGVSASAAPQVKVGAKTEWTQPDGRRQSGTVQAVQEQVDQTTGMVEVLVAPQAPTDLPLGLMVRGEIQVSELPEATLIRRSALIRHEDQLSVVTVSSDHLAKVVPVRVLGEHGDQIAVEGELKAGDKVVVEGGYNLPDGAKVHEGEAATEPATSGPAEGGQ